MRSPSVGSSVCAGELHSVHHLLFSYFHSISKPFLKERASDETKYAAAVIETFLLLGKMMAKSPESVQCQIATAVASFYSDKTEEHSTILPEGTCVYSIHVHVPVRLYIIYINLHVHTHTPYYTCSSYMYMYIYSVHVIT